jgi:hypothetical protein
MIVLAPLLDRVSYMALAAVARGAGQHVRRASASDNKTASNRRRYRGS